MGKFDTNTRINSLTDLGLKTILYRRADPGSMFLNHETGLLQINYGATRGLWKQLAVQSLRIGKIFS